MTQTTPPPRHDSALVHLPQPRVVAVARPTTAQTTAPDRLDRIEQLLEAISDRLDALEGTRPARRRWYPLSEAVEILGISRDAAYNEIALGRWREGHEVVDRRRPESAKPWWFVDVSAVSDRDVAISRRKGW